MFCPNCGKELKIPNQSFCIYCGNELTIISKTSQSRTNNTQYYVAIPRTKPISADIQIPVRKKERTIPGPHSKKCLIFGILSIVIVLVAYYIGSNIMSYLVYRTMFQNFYSNYYSIYQIKDLLILLFVLIIIFIIVHIVGTIFGILSRVNRAKAKNSEPVNNLEKVGSVIGILGIICNAIALIASLIFMVVIFTIF